MRHHVSRRRLVALAVAVTACLPVAAQAEDPVTTGVDLANDTIATGLDSLADLQRSCIPIVTSWTPYAQYTSGATAPGGLQMTPHIKNTSTWYLENGGAIAHLSCSASVLIRARVSDVSAPGFATKKGSYTNTYLTSKDPKDTGTNDVPYFGPDAPVLRPYGQVTVHVEVFRRLSTGRYATVRSGCTEFHYLVQPAASLQLTDPTAGGQGACAYDAPYLVLDTADSTGVESTADGTVSTLLGPAAG